MAKVEIYKVGGYVRDKLLGLTPTDCDYVVVGATVEYMQKKGFIQVGKDFPVFLHPKTKEEYALARTERKVSKGHTGFQVYFDSTVSLEDDLRRRDITINAIAEDDNGNFIDPYGGLSDLKNQIIRHVSAAFCEDPLRILRVSRFAAKLNFTIANETLELMKEMAQQKCGLELSKERVVEEFEKATKSGGFGNYILWLDHTGNLSVFFPCLKNILSTDLLTKSNQFDNSFDVFSFLFYYIHDANQLTLKRHYLMQDKTVKNIKKLVLALENKDSGIVELISRLKIKNNYELICDVLNSFSKFGFISLVTLTKIKDAVTQIYQHKFIFNENITNQEKLGIINEFHNEVISQIF